MLVFWTGEAYRREWLGEITQAFSIMRMKTKSVEEVKHGENVSKDDM